MPGHAGSFRATAATSKRHFRFVARRIGKVPAYQDSYGVLVAISVIETTKTA
jgi:hypothetical protein